MGLFSKAGAIGLNISDFSVEALQLKSYESPQKFEVQGWGRAVLPSGLIINGALAGKEAFLEVLKQLWRKPNWGSFAGDEVIMSIPEMQTYTVEINFPPQLDDEQIRELIPNEMIQMIPFALEEVDWDFGVMERSQQTIRVLAAVSPKIIISDYYDILTKSGMKLEIADLESAALVRCFDKIFFDPSSEAVLVVDAGAYTTLLFIYDQAMIRKSYHVGVGGNTITEIISKELQLSFKDAELKKRQIGMDISSDAEGRVVNIIQQELQKIMGKLQAVLRDYEHERHRKVSKILLTGGTSGMPMIDTYFGSNLDIPAILTSDIVEDSKLSGGWGSLFSAALGLAKRGLLPSYGKNNGIDFLRYR